MSDAIRSCRVLDRAGMPNDAVELARALIGVLVIREPVVGDDGRCVARIVETEAYVPGDAAGHAYGGMTARNASLFRERGHAYVYFIYGMYWCFNVSAERAGIGAGVLVRAAEPIEGIPTMRRRRGSDNVRDLLRGPGRFARAFAIDRALDGADLCASDREHNRGIVLATESFSSEPAIGTSTRIGLSKETHRPLRFFERDSRYVSGSKSINSVI